MASAQSHNNLRVVIVGPCASGKSTLAAGLREHGYEVTICSQEHSEIPTFWQHSGPDVVIALDVDLATIRERRGSDWPESIYRAQLHRLSLARSSADLVIDGTTSDAQTVLSKALTFLCRLGNEASPKSGQK